ncbi:DUF2281 domain-containing protein [Sulfurihydrogenibium azorense]|jgi:hypothetical protein|uniref:DUF2281 domain-containing protein n=1 Tax=Sulfurihydrogenibium azorense (strain DSM 15241 / OCM 825 / Az-Fu1) TaxID=204536 RepID=C1DTB8_SULAA|nr:DUF2281 domain-containing protein [Sulfurihydrogenibium azorense]ACN98951.1 conserved hypothetical protein [Sulfurihydrogenibium azorense Az-Fu1]MDM7274425.1 DUF2281 domain-containing protein [Sulfurihydrogenibium azorense]
MKTIKDQELISLIESLPDSMKKEVKDFVEYLLYKSRKKQNLKLSWKGGLSEYKDRFTSLELEKKALEWRIHP